MSYSESVAAIFDATHRGAVTIEISTSGEKHAWGGQVHSAIWRAVVKGGNVTVMRDGATPEAALDRAAKSFMGAQS